MKRIIILEMILISFIWSSIVIANIYTWTDTAGVRHFSNQSQPAGAALFLEDSGPNPDFLPERELQNKTNDSINGSDDTRALPDDRPDQQLTAPDKFDRLEDHNSKTENSVNRVFETVNDENNNSFARNFYPPSEATPAIDGDDYSVDRTGHSGPTYRIRRFRRYRYGSRHYRHSDRYASRNPYHERYDDSNHPRHRYLRNKKHHIQANPYKRYHHERRYRRSHRYRTKMYHRSRRLGVYYNRRH